MVRDYKKDFCKENKESALLSKKFKKKIAKLNAHSVAPFENPIYSAIS